MIGKNQIQITGTQFAAGLCTSNYLSDGGMGTESANINPLITQGLIYATGTFSNSGLSAAIVASSEDFQNPSTTNRWIVDTSSNFYYVGNSNTITLAINGSVGYLVGTSDMVPFDDVLGSHASALYISSATDITRLSGTISGGLSIGAEHFWTSTKSKNILTNGIPHPLLVYQNQLWIGNGNHLPNMDTSGTANNDASWVLDVNEEIYALGIDPGTGLMMVSVRSVASGTNGSTPAKNYIYLYDGYSSKPRRKVPVQGTVFSFTTNTGQVIVGIDNSIGYWNGNGVSFLRRLSSSSIIPYKHRCLSVNNIFMVVDGAKILCYGDIQNGKKVWFPLYSSGNNINTIWQQSLGSISINNDTSTVSTINLFDTGAGPGSGTFDTNTIYFERPINIYDVEVFTTGITTTAGIGGLSMTNEEGATITPTQNKFVVASGTQSRFLFSFGGARFRTLQPRVTLDTQAFGLIRLNIYYNVAE